MAPPTPPPAPADCAYLEDFQGKADGSASGGDTDNGPALVKALAQATAAGVPVLLRPGDYCVASTADVANTAGARLLGGWGGRRGPFDVARGACRLFWDGPSGGTLFSLRGMNYEVGGFAVACCQGTQHQRAFALEAPDAGHPVSISTEHYFHGLSVLGYYGPVARGFVVSERPGTQNNEFHRWEGVLLRGLTYAGVHVPGGGGQVKGLQFEDCSFVGPGQFGFSCGIASADFSRCNFTGFGDGTALFGGGAREPVTVQFCHAEGCRHMLQWAADSVLLRGNRFAADAINAPAKPGPGKEFIGSAGSLVIEGDLYDGCERPGFVIGGADGARISVKGVTWANPWPFPDDEARGTYYHFTNAKLGNRVLNGPRRRQYSAADLRTPALALTDGRQGEADAGQLPVLSNVGGRAYLTNPGQPPRAL